MDLAIAHPQEVNRMSDMKKADEVAAIAQIAADALTFAQQQSAVTSTELIA